MEEEMKTITGVIKAISQKEETYGVMLHPKDWYNAFGECPVKKGETVTIEYTVDGSWKNIQDISIDKLPKKPSETSEKVSETTQKNLEQLSSIYKNCLVLAKELLTPYKTDKYDTVPLEEVRIVATTLFIAYNKLNE